MFFRFIVIDIRLLRFFSMFISGIGDLFLNCEVILYRIIFLIYFDIDLFCIDKVN